MSLISRVEALLKLRVRWFRRTVTGLVTLSVVGLLIAAIFTDKVKSELGFGVASAAILYLLALLVDHLVELRTERDVEAFESEAEATEVQTEFVKTRRPRWVKMYEFSAASVTHVFHAIASSGSVREIKLLVAHPCSMSPWQRRQRLLPAIASLSMTFPLAELEHLDLQIRCYRSPPSLRGRNYGGALIAVGWYTHDSRESPENWPEKGTQLWGDPNALVVAPSSQAVGAKLTKWFDEVFERVWAAAMPIDEALPLFGHDVTSHEWLARVSEEGTASKARRRGTKPAWKPDYELEEDDSRYLLRIRDVEEVGATSEDDVLTIRGRRRGGKKPASADDRAEFTRCLSLPSGVKVGETASNDGVVEITLSK